MKVLITTIDIPGYLPNLLAEWLKTQDVELDVVTIPSRYNRKVFIPGISHQLNAMEVVRKIDKNKYYDIAIAPDPVFVKVLKNVKNIGKRVYWRLDYYPQRFKHFDFLYQKAERKALENCDEIWSISDPKVEWIAESLQDFMPKVKYVPYMLESLPIENGTVRQDKAIWIGPDRDGSREPVQILCKKSNIPMDITDYSIPEYRVSESRMKDMLFEAKVGLAIYSEDSKSCKYYSDPARIKHYLAHGLPVIVNKVPPIYKEIKERNAGIVIEELSQLPYAVRRIFEDFDTMSKNARSMAEDYTFNLDRLPL